MIITAKNLSTQFTNVITASFIVNINQLYTPITLFLQIKCVYRIFCINGAVPPPVALCERQDGQAHTNTGFAVQNKKRWVNSAALDENNRPPSMATNAVRRLVHHCYMVYTVFDPSDTIARASSPLLDGSGLSPRTSLSELRALLILVGCGVLSLQEAQVLVVAPKRTTDPVEQRSHHSGEHAGGG